MEEDTSGFYKLDEILLFGPNGVVNSSYELLRDLKDQYNYPVDGWYWFDNREAAKIFFNLPLEENVGQPLPGSILFDPQPHLK